VGLELEKESRELVEKIDDLEKMMSKLYDAVVDLKEKIDKIASGRKRRLPMPLAEESLITRERISEILGTTNRTPNPWAVDAAISLLLDSEFFRRMIRNSYNTYRPTIEALKRKSDWLSANEVSKITGRKRNTESTYLYRLFNAGLVERKKFGRKIAYKLLDDKKLSRAFGISR
jgi:DNA-binding transcriptional ArsR family regulator